MGFGALQSLDTVYPCIGKLSHGHNTNLVNLFHLQGRVLPDPRAKASSKLKRIPCTDRVSKGELTVDDAAYETINMGEHHALVLLEREFVLLELLSSGDFDSSQSRLYKEGYFVSRKGDVDFHRELDAISLVDFLIQRLFAALKTDFPKFVCLSNNRKLGVVRSVRV